MPPSNVTWRDATPAGRRSRNSRRPPHAWPWPPRCARPPPCGTRSCGASPPCGRRRPVPRRRSGYAGACAAGADRSGGRWPPPWPPRSRSARPPCGSTSAPRTPACGPLRRSVRPRPWRRCWPRPTPGRARRGWRAARARWWSPRAGTGAVFVATGMSPPPRGKVYQLWFADGEEMRSAGLMAPGRGSQTVLMRGPVGGASDVGITVEPAGGSKQPTSEPVALLDMPA
nr:anti-sigma factor [Streptomyces sp. MJP52]